MSSRQKAAAFLRRSQDPQAIDLAQRLESGCDPIPEQVRLGLVPLQAKLQFSPVLAENRAILDLLLGASPDLVIRPLQLGSERHPALLIFLDSLAKRSEVTTLLDSLIVDLRQEQLPTGGSQLLQELLLRAVTSAEATPQSRLEPAIAGLLSGDSLLLVEGLPQAIILVTSGWDRRKPEEPMAEPVVRGPKEGYTETLSINLALTRRRLKDLRLRVERVVVGSRTATEVVIIFMAGLALPELVQEVRDRLGRIQIDGVLESGYLEEMIEDNPLSPFPQVKLTERPDVVTGAILEGRVAILTDGTPHALLMPATFAGELQAAEDYYQRWPMASFLRLLRYLFLVLALFGPGVYIAITTYHHEMIPTTLLLSLIASREGVPFPALVEALMMELTLEALREAGVRLPKPVGQSISIVGALVIGEAAVRAGLVSPVMVIVVSVTAIASFIIPTYSTALTFRMLRFGMMFAGGLLGFYGIVIAWLILAIHLCSLRSFGVPYLTPITPPVLQDMQDVIIRLPWWSLTRRPKTIPMGDHQRGKRSNRPGPPRRKGG